MAAIGLRAGRAYAGMAFVVGLGLFAAGCGSSLPTTLTADASAPSPSRASTTIGSSWITKDADEVLFVQWVESDGSITGTLEISNRQSSKAGISLQTNHLDISGTVSNGKISLDTGSSLVSRLTGTVDGDRMELTYPEGSKLVQLVFTPGTSSDYNSAVSALKAEVDRQEARLTATQQTQNAVTARTDYQASLLGLSEAATTVQQSTASAMASRDAFNAANNTFTTYSNSVIAGTCWNQEQFDHAQNLYQTTVTAYQDWAGSLESLKDAVDSLSQATGGASSARNALTKANQQAAASGGTQSSVPDGSTLYTGQGQHDQADELRKTMTTQSDQALTDAENLINGFPTEKFCT